MSGRKRGALSLMKVPLTVTKQNGYSASFRICHDDVTDTVMVDVSHSDCVWIAANLNRNGGEERGVRTLNLSRA